MTTTLPSCLVHATHVVHLKGFGSRRFPAGDGRFDDVLVQLLLDAVGTGVVVWDGDEFAEDSFTRILDKALSKRPIHAVAFYWQHLEQNFLQSWELRAARYPSGLHLMLLDEHLPGGDAGWVRLGLSALKLTGASEVLCLGGGGVVAEEAALSAQDLLLKGVRWRLVPLPRLADGLADGSEDYGHLHARFCTEKWPNFECLELAELATEKAIGPRKARTSQQA